MAALLSKIRSRAKRRLVLALAAAVAAFLVLEAGYRVVLYSLGAPHSSAGVRARMAGMLRGTESLRAVAAPPQGEPVARRPEGSLDLLSPYVGLEHEAALARYAPTAAYFKSEEGERNLDVLLLGGSAAARLPPESLVDALRADPRLAAREVRLHCEARDGFKQPQQLILAGMLFALGWRPDLVINVDGFGEVALGNENRVRGTHPIYPALERWAPLVRGPTENAASLSVLMEMAEARHGAIPTIRAALFLRLHWSAVLSSLALHRVDSFRQRYSAAMEAYTAVHTVGGLQEILRGPPPPLDLDATLTAVARSWSESSLSLHALCRARAIPYVHVLEPPTSDPGSEWPGAWTEALPAGYARLREAGASLRSRGVAFHDAGERSAGESPDALARFAAARALEILP